MYAIGWASLSGVLVGTLAGTLTGLGVERPPVAARVQSCATRSATQPCLLRGDTKAATFLLGAAKEAPVSSVDRFYPDDCNPWECNPEGCNPCGFGLTTCQDECSCEFTQPSSEWCYSCPGY
jgi:hypothetical protein